MADLDAIRRRHAPPTSGPWDTSRGTISAYVVQARTDVEALLAECGRTKQELRERDEELTRLREQLDAARQALKDIAHYEEPWPQDPADILDEFQSIARVALGVEGEPEQAHEKPDGWPDKCASCGASWEHIGFDHADGFNCRACGRCDSDE